MTLQFLSLSQTHHQACLSCGSQVSGPGQLAGLEPWASPEGRRRAWAISHGAASGRVHKETVTHLGHSPTWVCAAGPCPHSSPSASHSRGTDQVFSQEGRASQGCWGLGQ